LIAGDSVVLNATALGNGLLYSWSPAAHINDITVLNPTVSPVADTRYTLSALSSYGCSGEDNVLVKVIPGIYVPSAFTPNGDGLNDTWKIPFLDIAFGADVSVYNRYGQLVYHTEGTTVSWNGMFKGIPQPAGIYVYLIQLKTTKLRLKGTVAIIR